MRIAIRGFEYGKRIFEELRDISEENLGMVASIAAKHIHKFTQPLDESWMIEIEFVDDPDVNARFFRMGGSPEGMAIPIPIDLNEIYGPKKPDN